jgi:hypothetical protein
MFGKVSISEKSWISYLLHGTFLLLFLDTNAQFLSRNRYQQVLEPRSVCISGAGQGASTTGFDEYWNAVSPNQKPVVFMDYFGLKNIRPGWEQFLKSRLNQFNPYLVVPQIGLSMTTDGSPQNVYDQAVANGDYDQQIRWFVEGLRNLAVPSYVRIGYEANGTSWNGYQPAPYRLAFARVANAIKQATDLQCATVWCVAASGGDSQVMNWYPGDSVVDWWAIDLFSASDFGNNLTQRFMDSAHVHRRPVMMGEATPRYVGVLAGQSSWDTWFQPFFNFMKNEPGLKNFGYINWNWSIYPQWSNWGDARIQQNAIVNQNFKSELSSALFLHADSAYQFLKETGDSTDLLPPNAISGLNLPEPTHPELAWIALAEPLAFYEIWKNNALKDRGKQASFFDEEAWPNDSARYKIRGVDRSGNVGGFVQDSLIKFPGAINKVQNSFFNKGESQWRLALFNNGTAKMEVDSTYQLSGKYSLKIHSISGNGANWHVRPEQKLNLRGGYRYIVRFRARTHQNATFAALVQRQEAPYQVFYSRGFSVGNAGMLYTDSFTLAQSQSVNYYFALGNLLAADTVFLDDIELIAKPLATAFQDSESASFHLFPNPSPDGKFLLSFHGQQEVPLAKTTIQVFDPMGKEVNSLITILPNQTFEISLMNRTQGLYLIVVRKLKSVMGKMVQVKE